MTYHYLNSILKRNIHAGSIFNSHFITNGKTFTLAPAKIASTYTEDSKYNRPLPGNSIQANQQKLGESGYSTKSVQITCQTILKSYKENGVTTIPWITAHDQRALTGLASLRLSDSVNQAIIETFKSNDLLTKNDKFLVNQSAINRAKEIILNINCSTSDKNRLFGWLNTLSSGYSDSVYIANADLKVVGKNGKIYGLIANYSDNHGERSAEEINTVAQLAYHGVYPLFLESENEGLANLKELIGFKIGDEPYVLCLGINSARSNTNCIEEINKICKHIGAPQFYPIILEPTDHEKFYHLDCLISFLTEVIDSKINFKSKNDVDLSILFEACREKAIGFIAEKGLMAPLEPVISKIFQPLIQLNTEKNPLAANIVPIYSDNGKKKIMLTTKQAYNEEKNIMDANFTIMNHTNHTKGGGGSHLCMTNILPTEPALSIDDIKKELENFEGISNMTIPSNLYEEEFKQRLMQLGRLKKEDLNN